MPPKKTETKTEGGAAAAPAAPAAPPKPKSGSHATYQVRIHDVGILKRFSGSNELQDMITDAIIAVFHPVPFLPAHLVSARGRQAVSRLKRQATLNLIMMSRRASSPLFSGPPTV